MSIPILRIKKGQDRRIKAGHPWIFSNEIDTAQTPLKQFSAGQEVLVESYDKTPIGIAYINPHSLIAARIFSRDPKDRLNTDFLVHRIKAALSLRERLFNHPFYRLVFSEADGLPGLIVDRFDQHLVAQTNTAGMEHKQSEISDALRTVLPNTESILLRNDSNVRLQEGLETYTKSLYDTPPDEVTLIENGVRFISPLWKGQKTGWFYDHRMNRARLKNYVKDKAVLDVFSYLGAFGVQAAVFGAKQVDCVEASKTACDYIHQNAALNQIEGKVNTICEDAFDALKALLHQGKSYDVIILDPPAFVKKAKDHKEGLLAYQRINELAVKLLASDGILVSCSCSMQVSMEDLIEMTKRIAYRTHSELQLVERGHQGPDHPIHIAVPETDYLKALFLVKM